MSYLVTGATGNIGGRVVERLIAHGERPRIFVRDEAKARTRFGAAVDIAVGDLADARALAAALEGIDALFLVNTGHDLARLDALAAKLAKQARATRVVKLSALGARASGEDTAVALWHAQGEAAIQASGVAYTFIQPVGFMSNALAWASSIKAIGRVRASTGDGRIAMIHPDDIAAVAMQALSTRQHDGQSLAITGPEALTYTEMTNKLGAAIGRSLQFESITDEQARASLLDHGLTAELADALVVLWREVRDGQVATVTSQVERVTGQKPITFDDWAAQNAAAFR
jgi:uncharacterized protein YbjT (DUF2867 family)